MIYEELIERMLNYYTGSSYTAEVAEAKREFFEQAGILDEASEYFESRMAQFLDWYLFTRELSKVHLTPVQLMCENPPYPVDENEKQSYESLSHTRHSLFEFIKIKGHDVVVEDLFKGKKVILKKSNVLAGFNSDEIFEARIIPFEDNFVFTQGFCFHPPDVKKFILKEIKKVKHLDVSQQEELMFRLLKMRYKHEQYRHIRVEYIYSNDQKLRI